MIAEKELIEACVDLYRKNCSPEQTGMTGEKHFYYSSGNMNAINYICCRLGIDIAKELKNVYR